MSSAQQLNELVRRESGFIQDVLAEVNRTIVGQERLIHRLLVALLCNGHILIEGVPGLAKTLAVRTLAATIQARFQRLQFTPDLLPADLIGTQIYNPRTGEFAPRMGPIFSNLVLADEINRAPAKVQSALLEAMEERQVTLGDQTYPLHDPFMVLATQNPIEQAGTYPLPEAQLDRFMLKVVVEYPTRAEERAIMERMAVGTPPAPQPVVEPETIRRARAAVNKIYVDEKIKDYVLNIIFATRDPASNGMKDLRLLIDLGASPRATIFLLRAAKANAFLRGRGYVIPDDIKQIAPDVLRHRILLTFEAEAEDITTAHIIQQILSRVEVP
ncbi:MAG: MoxR family ATPase [Chloroflexi bacterium]|nr:MoxR family ATPase [Chloroflexota bacterium]MDL1885144.1 MoxR family ATPase [Anaerolineae bacterium CFX8]